MKAMKFNIYVLSILILVATSCKKDRKEVFSGTLINSISQKPFKGVMKIWATTDVMMLPEISERVTVDASGNFELEIKKSKAKNSPIYFGTVNENGNLGLVEQYISSYDELKTTPIKVFSLKPKAISIKINSDIWFAGATRVEVAPSEFNNTIIELQPNISVYANQPYTFTDSYLYIEPKASGSISYKIVYSSGAITTKILPVSSSMTEVKLD